MTGRFGGDGDMLAWKEDFRLGVEELDGQHTVLFGIINQLDLAVAGNSSPECLGDVLFGLRAYAEFHFHTEEMFMGRYGYGRAPEHQAAHGALLAAVDAIIAGGGDVRARAVAAKALIVDWVIGHIQHEDRELAEFIESARGAVLEAEAASFFPR